MLLPMITKSRYLKIIPAICFLMFSSSAAYAGFEWTPPAQTTGVKIQAMPDISATPSLPSKSSEIKTFPLDEDMILEKENGSPSSVPQTLPIDKVEILAEDKMADTEEPVMGFGKDIPLVLAMRQVIPAEYAFIFDPGIDLSMRVNWNGGRPWQTVLEDMIGEAGLGLVISQKKVWVREESFPPVVPEKTEENTPDFAELQQNIPVLSESGLSEEPVDVVLKNKKYEVTEKKAEESYKKVPEEPEIYMPPPTVNKDFNYKEISREHEESYNPSYPRRTPMPIMSGAGESAGVIDKPVRLDSKEGLEQLPVRDVEMKKPIAPSRNIPALHEGRIPEAQITASDKSIDPYEIHFWQAEKGDSLRETLSNWSVQAGIKMIWAAHYDYRLPTPVRMHGTFPDAIKSLLTVYESSPDRPVGRLHQNLPEGPSVLVIESDPLTTQ